MTKKNYQHRRRMKPEQQQRYSASSGVGVWCFVYFQVVLLELNTFCCFWTLQIEFLSGFRKIKQKTNFERVFETQRTTAAVCSCAGFVVLHIQSDGSGYPQEIRTGGSSCIYISSAHRILLRNGSSKLGIVYSNFLQWCQYQL